IGQDTTSYGQDIGYKPGLCGLLKELNALAGEHGGAWLRLMYAYPSCFTDAMIDSIAGLPHVLKYIDMPLQHIDDTVLDRMKRRTSRKLIETLLAKLRGRVPDMAIRTTFISGFPGETDDQHASLVAFVKEADFEAMGVFGYSPEPGTPAGTMHGKGQAVTEDVIQRRVEELMLAQQDVVFARQAQAAKDGVKLDVLVDAAAKTEGKATAGVGRGGKLYVARSRRQAPQIDGVTYVQSRAKLAAGEVVEAQVVASDGYDLVARPVEEMGRRGKVSLPVVG
ncbi:MAG: radical SAM protein, partial [Phycisphaeraceae bacterium]|nr:radical SAM protein [Phycisphaeraceae bacterium]